MAKKYFGTDGIRGKVGQSPITADFFLKLGWAIGNVFANEHKGFVLVGKDTRISGYMFESALEAGLSAAGMDTRLLGPMPTPAIAYLTRTLRAKAGIVISASHNPYYDNGVKFFSVAGNKLADDLEYQIEAYLDSHMTTVTSAELGKAKRVDDAPGRYIEFCKATIPTNLDFNGLKIVLDCANGATYHIAPPVLSEIGATVHCLGCQPNGLNINDGCGSTHLQALINTVKDQQADLGIAFDGDGDRVMMVDHCGEIVDGDELLYIIAASRLKHQGLRAPVVGTLMSNLGLEQALASLQIPFIRAKVGDRYVRAQLQQHRGILGGENSGHIICLDRTTTGDGIVSALQVLEAMRDSGQSLHQLKRAMCKYPQVLVNVIADRKIDLNHPIIVQAVTEVERQLGDQGRVLLRASGTEPLVRIMVEGAEANLVSQLAEQLAQIIKKLLSA